MTFFKNKGAAEVECAYRNLYSCGQTYCVTDGPGDEETGNDNFAVMELKDAFESEFPCWIVFGDGSKSFQFSEGFQMDLQCAN